MLEEDVRIGRQDASCNEAAGHRPPLDVELGLRLSFHLPSRTLTMSSKSAHPWSATYVGLKLIALLLRAITSPAIFLGINWLRPHRIAGVTRRVEHVPSRDAGRTIRVHIYEKAGGQGEKKPVLVNFHGSGFGELACDGRSTR